MCRWPPPCCASKSPGSERHLGVEIGVRHPHLLDDGGRLLGQVDELAPEHEATGLEAADVEQLGDEPRHAIGVVVHLLEHHPLLIVGEPVPAIE